MKKLTLDINNNVHQQLRLLCVTMDRSISSIVGEAIDKILEEHRSLIPPVKSDD
jgi:hypothetical protein